MTNSEFSAIIEKMGAQAAVLVIAAEYDKSKIDDGLWSELCRMCREVEDYI